MKIPYSLKAIVAFLLLVGITGFILSLRCPNSHIPKAISDFTLVLTLIALLFYVYYTYVLARDASTPSASVSLQPHQQDPFHILVFISSSSRASLHCWCNLNAKVYGQPVSLGGFYNGESSFDVQPFGKVMGHFDIRDILKKAGRNLGEIIDKAKDGDKEQLYMDIEFWYQTAGTKEKVQNPKQPHYFDFKRNVLVTDF